MKKKTWVIIFVIIVIFIGLLLFMAFKSKGKYAKISDIINPVKKPDVAVPPHPKGGGASNWTPEYFPLDFGMYGDNIRLLQRALNIDDDGKFGNETWASLSGAGYLIPISESEFDELTGASPSIFPSSSSQLKGAYAKYDGTPIRNLDMTENSVTTAGAWLGTVTGVDDSNGYYELDHTYYIQKSLVDLV